MNVNVTDLMEDFGISHARVRNASVCDEFGEEDSKRPNIRFDGEFAVVGSFRGRPLDWETGTDASLVLVFLDNPRQTEIGDFHDVVLTHKHLEKTCQLTCCQFHHPIISITKIQLNSIELTKIKEKDNTVSFRNLNFRCLSWRDLEKMHVPHLPINLKGKNDPDR